MDRETKLRQADALIDNVLNAACLHVQTACGQDDGGVAGNWFSGEWDAALVDDIGDLWREPGDAPLDIPGDTAVEAVPYLALANIAQNTGNAVPQDFRDRFLDTFAGYIAEERAGVEYRRSLAP